MNNAQRPVASLATLLLIGATLLMWTATLLVRFWYSGFASNPTSDDLPTKISIALASVILLGIVCTLVLAALWLVSVVLGWRPRGPQAAVTKEIYGAVDSFIAIRGKDLIAFHLVGVACLGSFGIFFLQDSLRLTVGWSLLLPILASATPYTSESRYYPRMLVCYCVLLMMAGLKSKVLYDGSLLHYFSACWLSILVTLPVILTVVWAKVSTTGERDWHWRLLLVLPIGCFIAFFYTGPMLAFFNVHLDQQQASRVYPAVVTQKCAPHEAPLLRVVVMHNGGKAEHLIDFRPEVFQHSEAGDTVSVRIYDGYFGWPWLKDVQDEPLIP